MNAPGWCAIVAVVALVGQPVQAAPVLEYAPTPAGPWQPDPEATVVDLGDGTFRVLAPAEAEARFYRLMEAGAELAHCPLYVRPAVEVGFLTADLDSDGDTVPDCDDLCPGYDDRIDENGNGIPDDCELAGMARIAGGPFEMGDTFNEGDGAERPVHTVPVSTFYLDKYEVTKALWDEVRTWALAHGYGFDNVGGGAGAAHPVHTVSWYDIVKWCNARSEKEGLTPFYYTSAAQTNAYRTGQVTVANDWVNWGANGYRLSTEAEWEKGARGGLPGKRHPWGDTIDASQANYGSGRATPVGSYAANGYGLYDMAGNIWEWCWDWYDSGWYGGAAASAADPRGPDSGSFRVVRGGGWDCDPIYLRCAYRAGGTPDGRYGSVGFRCARGQP